jgi:hypothetical protein
MTRRSSGIRVDLQDIATKRGVPVTALPPATTWVDAIELDEGRM